MSTTPLHNTTFTNALVSELFRDAFSVLMVDLFVPQDVHRRPLTNFENEFILSVPSDFLDFWMSILTDADKEYLNASTLAYVNRTATNQL